MPCSFRRFSDVAGSTDRPSKEGRQNEIQSCRLSLSGGLAATFFVPIVKWITFTPCITGAMWGSPDGASRFQYPGWQGRLALYCVSGLVFCEITGAKKAASVQSTPRPLESSRLSRSSTLIDRTGPRFSHRRRRDQPQTWTGRTCQPDRECTRRCTV